MFKQQLKECPPVLSYSTYATDPRTDLEEDHQLWNKLLSLACEHSEELGMVLHGLRCGGTRLKMGKKHYILRPDIDPTGRVAWNKLEHYEEIRDQFLTPYSMITVKLLKQL